MAKFTNLVGDLAAPFFVNVVVQGLLSPTAETPRKSLNVFDFRRLTNSAPYVPLAVADAFNDWWGTNLIPILSDKYTYSSIDVHALDDPTSAVDSNVDGGVGANDDDLYASDVAVYFQLLTGFRGRSYFGSKHFGGATEGQIDEGYLSASGVTDWSAVKTAILALATAGFTDTNGNAWKLVVLSRELSNLEASPAIFTGADVTSILLNKRAGTMGNRRGNRDAI